MDRGNQHLYLIRRPPEALTISFWFGDPSYVRFIGESVPYYRNRHWKIIYILNKSTRIFGHGPYSPRLHGLFLPYGSGKRPVRPIKVIKVHLIEKDDGGQFWRVPMRKLLLLDSAKDAEKVAHYC